MITDFLEQLLARFKRWNHRRATIHALHGLSDWQLRDIGLTRDEIPAVVEAAFEAKGRVRPSVVSPASRARVARKPQQAAVQP